MAKAKKQAVLELSGPSALMTATDTRHVLLRVGARAGADRSGHTPHDDVRVGGEGRVRRKKNGNIDFWWFVARRQKSRLVQRYGITLDLNLILKRQSQTNGRNGLYAMALVYLSWFYSINHGMVEWPRERKIRTLNETQHRRRRQAIRLNRMSTPGQAER